MATLAELLAARPPRHIAGRRHLGQQLVDAARLFRLGAKHPLAKIAVLGLGHNELSLGRGEFLPELGDLTVVPQLHPLQALHRLAVQGSILTRLQLQLDVLAPGDADEFAVERLGAGALLCTTWVGGTGTGTGFQHGPRDFGVHSNR